MDLALTESQELLRTTARSFMEREAPVDVIVGLQKRDSSLAPDLWQKAARLGWLGILIPAEYGGSGERLSDAAVLYEEMGRGPLPGPFFSSGVLGALTVLEGASEAQRRQILPGVATGERVLTVAITEPNASWGPGGITLVPQGRNGSYVLNGTKLFVADATSATDLVVAVRTGEGPADVSLLHVDAKTRGVTTRRLPGFVSWQCEVSFDNVVVPASALLGEAQRGWAALSRALERALPLLCAGRPVPARAGPRHPSGEPPGQRALDDVGGALEARHRAPRRGQRAYGQGRRERGLSRRLQRGARGTRRHGSARGVRAGGAHADVADLVPLPRRSAVAQAGDG